MEEELGKQLFIRGTKGYRKVTLTEDGMLLRERNGGYKMKADFSENVYYGHIVKGDLTAAIDYVKQFPEQARRYERFRAIFEQEQYICYEADAWINDILIAYQQYYREVFYLCIGKENAAGKLRGRLAEYLEITDEDIELCDMEQNQITEAFRRKGFHFLGGRTSGYYGPYIWQTTESRTYEVELPDGIQTYTVKFLDGFIARSWPDYLSFGEIGTGGWTDADGIINCIRASYDPDSETFKVSLLKHEAQHARDLSIHKNMSSEDLEYRAKLVELIYSVERNLLEQFAREAASSDKSNGHASAAERILDGFAEKLKLRHGEMSRLPAEEIHTTARILFEESYIL